MSVARIYLGALLALMALGQLVSLGSFLEAIEDYDVSPLVLAPLLIVLELLSAAGLLAPVPSHLRRAAARLGVATAVLWSLLALEGLARGLEIDNCGCFGRFLSQPLTIWVLPQDALFLALAIFVMRAAQRAD